MTRRLKVVPTHPRRVLGVVRVSKEREGMISPELQEHAITTYCATAGHELVGFVHGIDESGSQRRSSWWRKLDEAVAQVEAGTVDGIVVWKFSRVARQRLKWAVELDRVEAAGGILESATEQFDTTTSAGRFARGMTAEMNAFQAEMIGESWRETHERRVRQGLPHSGSPRYGYRRHPDTKMFVADPVEGPVLAELYRRYVAGESLSGLATWLNGHAHATARGGRWTPANVGKTLDRGFAAGFITFRGELHPGVHEPLIDAELWRSYQAARRMRAVVPGRRQASRHPLSGLVRCADCGATMVIHTDSKAGVVSFRCRTARDFATCRAGYIKAHFVEASVVAFLAETAAGVDEAARVPTRTPARTIAEVEGERLKREAVKIGEALVRLATSQALDPLPDPVYREARTRLADQQRTLEDALADARARIHAEDAPAIAGSLLEQWETLPGGVRRQILASLIDCVVVRTGSRWMRVVEWAEVRG